MLVYILLITFSCFVDLPFSAAPPSFNYMLLIMRCALCMKTIKKNRPFIEGEPYKPMRLIVRKIKYLPN